MIQQRAQEIASVLDANPHGRIACFGSRETPQSILDTMEQTGAFLARHGFTIASGHALGADLAFERGCTAVEPRRMHVCLPWAAYNEHHSIHRDATVSVFATLGEDARAQYTSAARALHPQWHALSPWAQMLHARNMMIAQHAILGISYLNPTKRGGGGSGQCTRALLRSRVHCLALNDESDLAVLITVLAQVAR